MGPDISFKDLSLDSLGHCLQIPKFMTQTEIIFPELEVPWRRYPKSLPFHSEKCRTQFLLPDVRRSHSREEEFTSPRKTS